MKQSSEVAPECFRALPWHGPVRAICTFPSAQWRLALCLLTLLPHLLFADDRPILRLASDSKELPSLATYRDQKPEISFSVTYPPGKQAAIYYSLAITKNGVVAFAWKAALILPESDEPQSHTISAVVILDYPPTEKRTKFLIMYGQVGVKGALALQKLEAFPEKPGDFFKAFLAVPEGGRKISVFGDNLRLRNFLETNQIDYAELGQSMPDDLAAGAFRFLPEDRAKMSGLVVSSAGPSATLVFDPTSLKPPGIYQSNRLALVTLPLADELGADPRTEQVLVETLENLLANP